MKKLSHLLLIIAAVAFIFTACEGPMGPDGATGPQGPDGNIGLTGPKGDTGDSGTTTCIECHTNDLTMIVKTAQWEESGHGIGAASGYAGGRSGCSSCHSTQGFLASAMNGTGGPAVSDPIPINCYACHEIHSTYTTADWALTKTDAKTSLWGFDQDMGKGNLCVSCHQARVPNPMPVVASIDVVIDTITSSHYGAHYASQFDVLSATGGLWFGTGTVASTSMHQNLTDGCVSCHVSDDMDHTWEVDYANCVACHTDEAIAEAKVATLQAEVQILLDDLEANLIASGGMSDSHFDYFDEDVDTEWNTTHGEAAGWINWQIFTKDHSLGVHNPAFVKAMLNETLTALAK